MNRATKRERLRRIKRASITVALFSSSRAGIFSMRYAQSCIRLGRRKILEAWRMGHGRLPSSLANYLYKKAKRKERAVELAHRLDAWRAINTTPGNSRIAFGRLVRILAQ